ncbi:MAG TPA: patatin-like phospholipase family protein [Acidimicrobiales bacterium]
MRSLTESRTVFVLSGGGNLGAVQVGMLQALIESGVRPNALVGTSVGALNGAFLSGHCDLAGVEKLGDLWMSIRRGDVFPFGMGSLLRIVTGNQRSLVETTGLRNLLARANLGFERLEEAPIPLRVIATDLETGEPVVLRRGEIVPALLASSAIPGIFPTVQIGGRTLVDGAMVANTPVGQAEELNPSDIYVLCTMPARGSGPPANALGTLQRAMTLSFQQEQRRVLAEAATRRAVHVIPAPEVAGQISGIDFNSTRRLISEAYELARNCLETDGARKAHRAIQGIGGVATARPEPRQEAVA